ncbi:hypothetical protein HZF05_08430 [Sphingomonas sp. CGMCC 1.13654]|uniref:Uncharacterized protein n=1 Tax=Sphingomonas chungangi TaxID=2683589 RepID=A0A838L7K3_9SPHN|nr:hypothetical protein [Sphingomonas chungangi]MBA2934126.1 hypothetical protein [Sphingomonas chungangi]MVW57167.1 hypothetical protein [Sphingomonas chungangi]
MTDAKPAHHEGDPDTHKVEHDEHSAGKPQASPKLNAVGLPEPETEQPVDLPHPDRPHGERQDGPGAGPRRADRHDAVPAGSTHATRKGADQGKPEEPDAAHRGQPALLRTGEASGSGASAGGTRHGAPEEPATDSAGGAGRDRAS